MRIGYARVSTTEQNIDAQLQLLKDAGCKRTFADRGIGGDTLRRPQLDRLLEQLRDGDIVVFQALDRLARNLRFLLEILDTIEKRGAGVRSLSEPIVDTTTPSGEFVLQIFGVIAEFERQRIRQRIHAGLDHAKRNGKSLGRPRALNTEKAAALAKLRRQGTSIAELGGTFGVSAPTIRKYLASQETGDKGAGEPRRPWGPTAADTTAAT